MEPFYANFRLSQTQLLPILESIVGEPVTGCTVLPSPEDQSDDQSEGQKRLVAFLYTTQGGKTAEVSLFVKTCVWKGRSETVHYRHLATKGVPTPRLYGNCRNAEGQEVIFLEPLSAVGFRDRSESEWRAMLSLLARFNACPVPPAYAPHLHPFEQVSQIDGGIWITGLHARPSDEEIEAGLKVCGVAAESLPTLKRAAHAVFTRVLAQPQGLLHQDFLPDNFGWRGEREEMVVFDLHKNSLGPRFADVAPYLSAPNWSRWGAFLDERGNNDNRENTPCTRREALTQHYLDEYARIGGARVLPVVFHTEVSALFWAHKITVLPWLAEQGQGTRIEQVLSFLKQTAVRD